MSYEPVTAEEAGVDPARLDVFLRRVRLEVEHGTAALGPGGGGQGRPAGRLRDLRRRHPRQALHPPVGRPHGRRGHGVEAARRGPARARRAGRRRDPRVRHQRQGGRHRRARAHPHRRLPVRPARLPEDARPDPAARGLLDVAPRLGAGQPPAVPPDRRGVGHRRAGRAPHRAAASPTTSGPRSSSPSASGSCCPCPPTATTRWWRCPWRPTARATSRRSTPGARGTWPNAEVLAAGEPSHSIVGQRGRPGAVLPGAACTRTSGRTASWRRRRASGVGAALRRQALRRQRRDRQPRPVLHGERRDRRLVDARAPARPARSATAARRASWRSWTPRPARRSPSSPTAIRSPGYDYSRARREPRSRTSPTSATTSSPEAQRSA